MYPMERRIFIAGLTALGASGLATAGHAQGAEELARIDAYLNAMRSAQGTFVQYNSDGSTSEGEYWIKKPGLMKFEYAQPHPHIIVADGVWVAVIDRSSNDAPQQYPIRSTPLNLILRDETDLLASGVVRRITRSDGRTTIMASDDEEDGSLEMVFDDNPIALRQWVTINPQGQRTTIELTSMEQNVELPRRMFSIQAAARLR
ncbi:Outer membrane lipoprotein-sorting protein [Monaibacterium marinum]|uniref:Outer membrane lipoprotein-sorting protein n=2 Tax=Pontivivens marinum TaxID=1690039 RepID=A0A2C9CM35_9RHOB|nr:Outer membrane lipoprotein-sorting protein [Monaibacterium marinum]